MSCSDVHLDDGIDTYDVPISTTQPHAHEDGTTDAQMTSNPAYGETSTKITSNPAYGVTRTKLTSNPAYGVVHYQHQKHVTASGERIPY